MEPGATLYIYKGEWGLPSIDFDCIRAACAVKFSEAPVDININGNPLFSGGGMLPYLQTVSTKIVGYRKIADYLQNLGYNINKNLSNEKRSLSTAYEALIYNNLHPYFYYVMFGDPQNLDTTRTLYAKRTMFPFNFYYPGKYIKDANKVMEVFAGFSVHEKLEDHNTDQIVYNAKRCINLLSTKLGKNKWFLGDTYSEFDAIVYAYCSILYHINLPSNALQAHIRECSNLVKFIDRVTKIYFEKEGFSTKSSQPQKAKNATILTPSEQDFQDSKRKTQILAGVGALAAMSTYAAYTGLLKISYDGQYEDDFGYEEDDEIGPEQ